MRTVLSVDSDVWDAMYDHLLPPNPESEEAAFLFARHAQDAEGVQLDVIEAIHLVPHDFRVRSMGFLDLEPATHERMIKTAHDLSAVMIEVHSHPYSFPNAAAFSLTDKKGLDEIVPNIMWRLPRRPYAALVVAPDGLDAVIWHQRPLPPAAIVEILIGDRSVVPTGLTLRRPWR